jgi:hypothetical protein
VFRVHSTPKIFPDMDQQGGSDTVTPMSRTRTVYLIPCSPQSEQSPAKEPRTPEMLDHPLPNLRSDKTHASQFQDSSTPNPSCTPTTTPFFALFASLAANVPSYASMPFSDSPYADFRRRTPVPQSHARSPLVM